MILTGISLTFGLLCGGFLWLWIRERQQTTLLNYLTSLPSDVCCLFHGDKCLIATPQIGNYLKDNNNTLNTYHGLSAIFSQQYWREIEQAIRELMTQGTNFQIRCKVQDDSRWVRVAGKVLSDPGQWSLWIKDITEEITRNQERESERHNHETMVSTLRSLLDTLPFLVWHRDEDQKINYCNKFYSEAVQLSQREVIKNSTELITASRARALARQALNTLQPQSIESSAIIFGERKKIQAFEQPNPLGDGTIGYAIDQTEVEETKSTLGKIIDSFSDILDHQSTAIAIYGTDRKLKYFNKAYQTLNNMEEEWLKSEPSLDEVLDELQQRRLLPETADFPAYKKRKLRDLQEQLQPEEELIHLPNGRTLRSITTPHPTGGLLFMLEDVTDHLKLESKNKALMEVQETTLENLYEGIVVFGSDNKIKLFNPSFCRLWNLSTQDIGAGMHLSRVIDKIEPFFEYEGEWQHLKARIVENTTDRIPKTGQIHRKDKSALRFLYIPLPNGDNLLSYIDNTDNSRVEEALKERNEALRAADRLKTEFIANVSYELRAPLNTISGFSEMLTQEYYGNLNEKQKEYIDGILNSSDKLLYLVNNLLDLGSIEAGYLTLQPKLTPVKNVLEEVNELLLNRAHEKNIEISVKCPRSVGNWLLDEKRIKQAVFNLLCNAIQFTPNDGKVSLVANVKDEQLRITITDTGVGIAKEDQTRVFNKFVRGSESDDGAGLGLSLVKSLMELHGGTVEIKSEPNKGTKVTCTLPKSIAANQDDTGTPLVVEYSK